MTPDPLGVMDFYATVFGWEGEAHDLGEFGEHVRFSRCGLVTTPEGSTPCWIAHLGVPDVMRAVEAVFSRGGSVIAGPFRGPGGLLSAVVVDDQGIRVGLSPAEQSTSEWAPAQLQCPDPDRARRFWEGVIAWGEIQTGPAQVRCGVTVPDLDAVVTACQAAGGSSEKRGSRLCLRDPHGATIDVLSRAG